MHDDFLARIKAAQRILDILTRSLQQLSQFKDKHRGQRCVIIGNGPSLNKMDLSFLKNEITFGTNRIYLGFERWNFTPTYYVSVNPFVIQQSAEEILRIPSPKFLSNNAMQYISDPSKIIWLQSIPAWFFGVDPRNGICEGHTVTYVAMQLAYFMGFCEVILIGVDHNFKASALGNPNQEIVSDGSDADHFDPNYFGKGIRWQLPDLENSEKAYRIAKQVFEADGRKIIDATVDGKLTVFPKADYRDIFFPGFCQKTDDATVREELQMPQILIQKPFPKISIITPSSNQGQFLEECIDSVLSQNYPNLEYIIMDGGSTDNSVDIIKKYEKYLTYWQSQPDEGQYDAINQGFKKTTGEIMTWLNSDDILHPQSLEIVSSLFSQRKDIEWIMGRPNGIDEQGKQSWIFDYLPLWSREKYLKKQYKNPYIQQEGTFWKRSLWEKAGGELDTNFKLAADLELWARFFRYTQLYSVDALLGAYRSHLGQKTATLLQQYNLEAEKIIDREIIYYNQSADKTLLAAPVPITSLEVSDISKQENIYANKIKGQSILEDSEIKKISVEHYAQTKLFEEIQRINQLMASQRFSEAEIAINEALEKFPDSPELLNEQAVLKVHQGDKQGAKEVLLEIIGKYPSFYPPYNNLACIFWNDGNMENAAKYFEEALRISNYDRSVVLGYGEMLMSYKKYAKAKEIFEGYLKNNPGDSEVSSLLQKCENVLGKLKKLSQAIEKAI